VGEGTRAQERRWERKTKDKQKRNVNRKVIKRNEHTGRKIEGREKNTWNVEHGTTGEKRHLSCNKYLDGENIGGIV
jgi:hypothetical protein